MRNIAKFVFICAISTFVVAACNNYKPNITFSEAIKAGNIKAVNYYLKHGTLVNQKDENGDLPLVLAAEQGNEQIVKNLLKAGAQVEAKSNNGANAVFMASLKGNTTILEELLKAGALVNIPCEVKGSFLNKYYTGKSNLFKKTFERNINTLGQINPISVAMYNEHADVVRILAKAGADINEIGILHLASMAGYSDVVKELINSGADINAKDTYGRTALMDASLSGHTDVVRELIKFGANVNVTDRNGDTVLKLTKIKGHDDIVELLKSSGARE